MRRSPWFLVAALLPCAAACGDDSGAASGAGASGATTTSTGAGGAGAGTSTGTGTGTSTGTGGMGGGGAGPVTADALLALASTCNRLPGTTDFATDSGAPDTVPLCTLNGAVFWQADMDIDCDGGQSAICMSDPSYQPDTSATDSQGNPLDASTLPFVVLPLNSNGFTAAGAGLGLGGVVAVVYNGQLEFGIIGDRGPQGIIGEASYAMAERFGIDPDPVTGGADSGVTYFAFTGPSAVVTKNEDHAEAQAIGEARAAALLANN